MASITATAEPANAWTRLVVDWTSEPEVTAVAVWRRVAGVETPVRFSYQPGGATWPYFRLSGGVAVLYDTEAPLNVPVTYVARAWTDTDGMVTLLADRFGRPDTAPVTGWGTADPGGAWTFAGLGDIVIRDHLGMHWSVKDMEAIAGIANTLDVDVRVGRVSWTPSPLSAPGSSTMAAWVQLRRVGVTRWRYGMHVATTGTITARISTVASGVETLVAQTVLPVRFSTTAVYGLRAQAIGTTARFKVWAGITGAGPEPADWTVVGTSATAVTAGGVSIVSMPNDQLGGAVVTLPVAYTFDDITVRRPYTQPVVTAGPVTLTSLDSGWLKDPLRPGNSLRIDFCSTPGPRCEANHSVFWAGRDGVEWADDAGVFDRPGSPFPTVTHDVRKGAASQIRFLTKTPEAAARVRELMVPGGTLLFQLPPVYGQEDRYIQVGRLSEAEIGPDRRKPWRVWSMPYVTTNAPPGPAEGVPGARYGDLCDGAYGTNALLAASGMTWRNVLEGDAT